jgi:hypothetical protein
VCGSTGVVRKRERCATVALEVRAPTNGRSAGSGTSELWKATLTAPRHATIAELAKPLAYAVPASVMAGTFLLGCHVGLSVAANGR